MHTLQVGFVVPNLVLHIALPHIRRGYASVHEEMMHRMLFKCVNSLVLVLHAALLPHIRRGYVREQEKMMYRMLFRCVNSLLLVLHVAILPHIRQATQVYTKKMLSVSYAVLFTCGFWLLVLPHIKRGYARVHKNNDDFMHDFCFRCSVLLSRTWCYDLYRRMDVKPACCPHVKFIHFYLM
jgi:hypothetical protein